MLLLLLLLETPLPHLRHLRQRVVRCQVDWDRSRGDVVLWRSFCRCRCCCRSVPLVTTVASAARSGLYADEARSLAAVGFETAVADEGVGEDDGGEEEGEDEEGVEEGRDGWGGCC